MKRTLREVAEFNIKQLVDKPESIQVKEVNSDGLVVLEFYLDKDDVGKVLGRKGATIEAIRHLLHCLATRQKQKVILQIEQNKSMGVVVE
ncbi:KH domain-containing protein [Lactococcus petauri]